MLIPMRAYPTKILAILRDQALDHQPMRDGSQASQHFLLPTFWTSLIVQVLEQEQAI